MICPNLQTISKTKCAITHNGNPKPMWPPGSQTACLPTPAPIFVQPFLPLQKKVSGLLKVMPLSSDHLAKREPSPKKVGQEIFFDLTQAAITTHTTVQEAILSFPGFDFIIADL